MLSVGIRQSLRGARGLRLQSTATSGLTWSEFLQLRKSQRRINFTTSIVTGFLGSTFAWGYVSTLSIDPTEMIFGMDPFTVYIGGVMVAGGIGYAVGPLFGDAIFKFANRKVLPDYATRQRQFLKRIIKNRVDAARQSMSNPVPDYYGEKIGSLADYRQWLRDCNTYRRKAREFL
ncbi:unnamed protein product [Kuraishia capsulata CBS 1993]|uniref:Presequence translocated-associated motor subunit PAM17 n=1 Tax=Kuraishia capsulata CBS 1993 TaxID=1382522 RepID=W6MFK3_9ASCO|nr:uncharacterized protein KUCA_T00000343001 [Kuraishia capsulata CBS 1993]CDK24381.1 unnamed protein product [Kuraishia capsulata CBS 1993]